jgi:alkyl hydroperoxide reductase subunit AhpC
MLKPIVHGVGNYSKEDYQEIYRISVDSETMHKTWEEWKNAQNRHVRTWIKLGDKVIQVTVTPTELYQYCMIHGLEINGSSRSSFIAWKLGQET